MHNKLTLRLEDDLIFRAKHYAKISGKSISQMVADYFAQLEVNDSAASAASQKILPITRSLRGVLKGNELSQKNYHDYLENKHK